MRTNIEIDDKLMSEALKVSHLKTKKQAVEKGLELLIRLENQKKILDFVGKIKFFEDYEI